MKNIIKSGITILMAAVLLFGCEPKEFDKSGLGVNDAPSSEEMSFTITPKADDPFRFTLVNGTPTEGVVTIVWSLGNGTVLTGNTVEAYYPLPGTYDLTLTITTNNGSSSSKIEQVSQTETDYEFLESPLMNDLTGGASAVEGKTWVVDSLESGHFGIGPVEGSGLEWWAATPLQKTLGGCYDDEFTFKLVGFEMDFINNGDDYVHNSRVDDPNYSNPVLVDGADYRVNFTPGEVSFSVTEIDGVNYISLASDKPAFFGFDYGGPSVFRIEKLNENELHVSTVGSDPGQRWYNKLIRKGYVRPIVEKPIEANDLMDDFEGNGNIDWFTDEVVKFGAISNFAPVPINESENIAIYQKGEFEWSNVAVTLDYRLDLSERNVFSMKVFMPGFNDYVTECNPGTDWLPTHNLIPQIDVKLHDSKMGGDAWKTQQVRGHVLSEDQLGKWVELEFDFSDVSDRTDFDKVVIQFGMEGHCNAGIFYMDDFMLK